MKPGKIVVCAMMVAVALGAGARWVNAQSWKWIETEKFRGTRGHWLTPELVEKSHELGLNVVFVSTGAPYAREEEDFEGFMKPVRDACVLAKKLGVRIYLGYHTLDPRTLERAIGDTTRRSVNAKGETLNTPCPRDPRYWKVVVENRAVILTEELKDATKYQLDGFLFDIEAYKLPWPSSPCYCDDCWKEYAAQYKGKAAAPTLDVKPADRAAWLDERGLAAEYRTFVEKGAEELADATRRRLNDIRPGMLFGLYPTPMHKGANTPIAKGLSTPDQPLILMPEWTYRGYTRELDLPAKIAADEALVGNPVYYVPGFNYMKSPSFPKWRVSLYMFAKVADGYWLYPGYRISMGEAFAGEEMDRARDAISDVNREIVKMAKTPDYKSPYDYRDLWPDEEFPTEMADALELARHMRPAPADMAAPKPALPPAQMVSTRFGGVYYIYCKKGEKVDAHVKTASIGYDKGGRCFLYSPEGEHLKMWSLQIDESADITSDPAPADGVYVLWGRVGDALEVTIENRHWAYRATYVYSNRGRKMPPMFFYGPQTEIKEWFFHVPEGCDWLGFSAFRRGNTQTYTVTAPDGSKQAEAVLPSDGPNADEFLIEVPEKYQGALWETRLEFPGAIYCPGFYVSNIPHFFSPAPDRALVLEKGYYAQWLRNKHPVEIAESGGKRSVWIEAELMPGFWEVVGIPGASGEVAHDSRGKLPLRTEFDLDKPGRFAVWVRTANPARRRSWVMVKVGGTELPRIKEAEGEEGLQWRKAGEIDLEAGPVRVELDVSKGVRADAVLLTEDLKAAPTGVGKP